MSSLRYTDSISDILLSHISRIGEQQFANLQTFTVQDNELLDCKELDGFRTSKPDVEMMGFDARNKSRRHHSNNKLCCVGKDLSELGDRAHDYGNAVPSRPPQAARASTWIIAFMTSP